RQRRQLEALKRLKPTEEELQYIAAWSEAEMERAGHSGGPVSTIGNLVYQALNPVEWIGHGAQGAAAIASGHPSLGAGLDVAGIIPLAGAARALRAGGEIVRGTEAAQAVARPIRTAAEKIRTVRLGEQRTQFPESQSAITSRLQRA